MADAQLHLESVGQPSQRTEPRLYQGDVNEIEQLGNIDVNTIKGVQTIATTIEFGATLQPFEQREFRAVFQSIDGPVEILFLAHLREDNRSVQETDRCVVVMHNKNMGGILYPQKVVTSDLEWLPRRAPVQAESLADETTSTVRSSVERTVQPATIKSVEEARNVLSRSCGDRIRLNEDGQPIWEDPNTTATLKKPPHQLVYILAVLEDGKEVAFAMQDQAGTYSLYTCAISALDITKWTERVELSKKLRSWHEGRNRLHDLHIEEQRTQRAVTPRCVAHAKHLLIGPDRWNEAQQGILHTQQFPEELASVRGQRWNRGLCQEVREACSEIIEVKWRKLYMETPDARLVECTKLALGEAAFVLTSLDLDVSAAEIGRDATSEAQKLMRLRNKLLGNSAELPRFSSPNDVIAWLEEISFLLWALRDIWEIKRDYSSKTGDSTYQTDVYQHEMEQVSAAYTTCERYIDLLRATQNNPAGVSEAVATCRQCTLSQDLQYTPPPPPATILPSTQAQAVCRSLAIGHA